MVDSKLDEALVDMLKKISVRDDLTPDQIVQIWFALRQQPTTVHPEVEVARIQAESTKDLAKLNRFAFLKDGVVTAALAAVATIATAYFTGFFSHQESLTELEGNLASQESQLAQLERSQQADLVRLRETNEFQLDQTELTQRADVIRSLLVIDPQNLGEFEDANDYEDRLENERKARICLLATFGILQIPDTMLGVDRSDFGRYSESLATFLNERYECDENTVPSSSWQPVGEVSCPTTLEIIRDRLPEPTGLLDSNVNHLMLRLALAEQARGIQEDCNPDRIRDYVSVVDQTFASSLDPIILPWSGFFISFLISESGNIHDLILSARNSDIWLDGRNKRLTFLPGEREVALGDMVFVARSNTNVDLYRTSQEFGTSHVGVVYSVDGDSITYIGGNLHNRVAAEVVQINDTRLIGLLRQ